MPDPSAPATKDAPAFLRRCLALTANGYFARVAPRPCVDDPFEPDLIAVVNADLGADRWPLDPDQPADDEFFDLIEVFHDLAARPRSRYHHDFADCGWHYSSFAVLPGQRLYRWRVNQLLERSSLNLRLADAGEDVGRLVEHVDDAREELITRARQTPDADRGAEIDHAIATSANAVPTCLPSARPSSPSAACSKRAARSSRPSSSARTRTPCSKSPTSSTSATPPTPAAASTPQRTDYDTFFLDWVFWCYLATIELTDRLLERQEHT